MNKLRNWAFALAVTIFVAGATVVTGQPGSMFSLWHSDSQSTVTFRALTNAGAPGFVATGTARPTLALTGVGPIDGELSVLTASSTDPVLAVYSSNSTAWLGIPTSSTAIAPEAANYVGFGSNQIIFEGATANDFELFISPNEPVTPDSTLWIPEIGEAAGTFMVSLLDTGLGDVHDVNAVWAASNALIFEGSTADAFETYLVAEDADTAIHTFQLPDNNAAADTYNLVFSVLDTNALDVANSIWFISNAIAFGGATGGNGFELQLGPLGDPAADIVVSVPNTVAGTLLVSALTSNDQEVANSVWGISGGLIFEGATADASELSLTVQDATADAIYQLRDAVAGTYGLISTGVAGAHSIEVAENDSAVTMIQPLKQKTWFRNAPSFSTGPPSSGAVGACSTTATNYIYGGAINGPGFEYDVKGTATACGVTWVAADGMGLTQDAHDNDGFELSQGVLAGSPVSFTIGTSPAFYGRVRFAIADITSTDQTFFCFRQVEDYQAASALGSYNEYYCIGLGDLGDGTSGNDWYQQTELNGAGISATDLGEANWTADQVHTIEIRVSGAGVATAYIEGSLVGDTAGFTFTDTIEVVAMFWSQNQEASTPDIDFVYWETGIQ